LTPATTTPRTTKNSSSTLYGHHSRRRPTTYKCSSTKKTGSSISTSSQSSVTHSRHPHVVRKSRRHKHNACKTKNSISRYSSTKNLSDTTSDSSIAARPTFSISTKSHFLKKLQT
jgi:hypothetical protein